MRNLINKIILPSLVIGLLVIGHCAFSQEKAYDGIWFLGFNTKSAPFNQLAVRQAVAHSLDCRVVAGGIASEETAPANYIPPGMTGFDPELQPYKTNLAYAKTLLAKAGFTPNSPELKNLSILHTDGLKTIEIAKELQKELRQIGLKIERTQVRYYDSALWETELRSGRHQLFLMGYKSEPDRLFTAEAVVKAPDSVKLLSPLFSSSGEANFTGYSQASVDQMLEQLALIDPSLADQRTGKLLEINRQLYRDLPALILFYIEKI